MDILIARISYLEKLISAKNSDESVLSQIKLLQEKIQPFAEILEPFAMLDDQAKWEEMKMLDVDFNTMSELQKYIKATNIHSFGNMELPSRDVKLHADIEQADHIFWNLVDSYAYIVDQMSNFFITLTSQLDALDATLRGIEDS